MEKEWYNLNYLNVQESSKKKYYIIKEETVLCLLKGPCSASSSLISRGMLVEAIENESNNALRVRVYSKNENEIWHKTEWRCFPIDLLPISQLIWHLLCSISNLEERIILVNNEQLCKSIENIKLNSEVWYCHPSSSSDDFKTYLARVKFIGPVPELGDGYYFGLDLMKNPEICEPSPITKKYGDLFDSQGIFTTLSNINPRKRETLDAIKNFEKNFLSNDILQSKKTDNFFITKNTESTDVKKNEQILNKDQYSLFADTDNNNQASKFKQSDMTSCITKNTFREQQFDNKLYKNLKCFDPLNSDSEIEELSKNFQHCSFTNDLKVGSCVKVVVDNDTHDGVIRWIGSPGNPNSNKLMAAIELDDDHPLATDGTYQNVRYFRCNPQKAWFTDLKDCRQYDIAASSSYYDSEMQDSLPIQSSVIGGTVPPISVKGEIEKICGKFHGIQGHHNSCYLDATLFSMFAFTRVFDNLLFRPPNDKDCPEYEEVQRVLREEIVNPLRKNLFVKADHVMKLRTLLEKSSSISGLTSEEKDPEEFLTSLVAQTLNAKPFLQLSSGQDAYHYQLFVEKDDKLALPTVQQLLEQSFLTSNVKLKEAPSCLILQMPRFGKTFKMYSKIQPTLLLDITDIVENSLRQCTVCGKLARSECRECYGQCGEGLESTAFCEECLRKVHYHERRSNHKPKSLIMPIKFEISKDYYPEPRLYLELLAVVCIETSHYVSFVKCASGPDAPWCFFDSMADRKGEQNGYNIPEMVPCPDFPYWLSEEGATYLATATDDRSLPKYVKRLLCDAYMCMYQSPDMYE